MSHFASIPLASESLVKRYQVFVSSTFRDLEVERQKVTWALQRMECIPAGMELFPAASDDQWTVIKRVIDESDYYLLIIAGRYGSLDKEGIGYTEKEFDYALSQSKPIVAFLHGKLDSLSVANSEQDPESAPEAGGVSRESDGGEGCRPLDYPRRTRRKGARKFVLAVSNACRRRLG